MIAVIMRQGQIRDVAWRVADFRKLRQQRFGNGEGALRRRTRRFELRVRDFAGVPDHRAAWMRDQEAGSKHFGVCQLSWLESERSLSYAGNLAAVENVQADSVLGRRAPFLF